MSNKTMYWAGTGLLTAIMLFSVAMYIFNYEEISKSFTNLGYPTHIIYPLALAKALGLIAIWTKKSEILKQWAYAGFFFDIVLAFMAHIMVNDGQYQLALIALLALLVSFVYDRKLFGPKYAT